MDLGLRRVNRLAWICGLLICSVLIPPTVGAETSGNWLRWGGPDGNFQAPSQGLAEKWPESGPKELWSRELGDGYSAVLVEDGRLYTMYRNGDQEAVIALSAKDGKILWEHGYDSAPAEGHVSQFGDGPRATPLISGDHIYTIGISGMMFCLKKKDGAVVWSHDLWKDFGGNFLNHGYSSSPVVYGDTVIALVGGEGHGIMAFNKSTGKVVWKNLDFGNSYSTPVILKVNGEDQLVTYMAEEVVGVDPANGELQWRYAISNQWKQNINMPVLLDGNTLFISTLQGGARGLKLTKKEGVTEVEELWSTRKIQFYHVTTVRQGDWIYGSTGGGAPNFMAAINVRTGEIGWRKRGFAKANSLGVNGKLLILDEKGKLALATASPEDLVVHAEAEGVLEQVAWTVPTVVGTTVYLRDKKTLKALDLS